MKMRAPEGTLSISIGGEERYVDEAGLIEVDDNLADTLKSHGFAPYVSASDMSSTELISRLVDRERQKIQAMSHDDLIAAYDGAEKAKEAEIDQTVKTDGITSDDIDMMGRSELFSFLRQKGIAVGAASNEVLRKAALEAIGVTEEKEPERDAAGEPAQQPEEAPVAEDIAEMSDAPDEVPADEEVASEPEQQPAE